jgi:hypothetical protein
MRLFYTDVVTEPSRVLIGEALPSLWELSRIREDSQGFEPAAAAARHTIDVNEK